MEIHSRFENTFGYIYGSVLLIIVLAAALAIICDFKMIPDKYCDQINFCSETVTAKVNQWLGVK